MSASTAGEPERPAGVVLGVHTHLDDHVAVAMDHLGRALGGHGTNPGSLLRNALELRCPLELEDKPR